MRGAVRVFVLPASSKGLSTDGRTITQATAGVAGDPRSDRGFGSSFASADFDHDGYADLAVGAVGGAAGSAVDPGTVSVLLGPASGLSGARAYAVTRAGGTEDDGFGASLATADLDGDGWADLAVGAPYLAGVEVPGEDYRAGGTVTVLRGGAANFSTRRSAVLGGRTAGADYDLDFGTSLAAGDVDGDARPDLVVGSFGRPFDDGDGHLGALSVCTSGAAGPVGCRQVSVGPVTGSTAVAVGNVTGDARNEIVVGQPEEDSENEGPGLVHTLSLSGSGGSLTVTDAELTQGSRGVPARTRPTTSSGPRSPSATSTPTATPTWSWARQARRSAAATTPGG